MTHQLLEHEFPTPEEWAFLTRCALHSAKGLEVPSANPSGLPNWGDAGRAYKKVCKRLEDPSIDGAGIQKQQGGEGISVQGVGEVGFDVSMKSEPWRRGYWQALMGMAAAAEHLDGYVYDRKGKHIFPIEYMIGPSNPDPTPTPQWMFDAPLEENCETFYEPPETFYLKILTTNGFNSRQRLEAALAYGEWLDFKHMPDTAEEVYKWALDIATSSLEQPEAVIDTKAAVMRPNAPIITENVLSAATALGTHYAQNQRPEAALPIFLSVLRARRSAPIDRAPSTGPRVLPRPQTDIGAFFSSIGSFIKFLSKVDYPPPPPSGDTPIVRTGVENCEEAKLMTYIGEILFASSKKQQDIGLRWTKDAIEIADARVKDPENAKRDELVECAECLEIGIGNWRMMVDRLVDEEEERLERSAAGKSKDWFNVLASGADEKKQEALSQEEEELGEWEMRLRTDNLKEKLLDRGSPLWATRLLLIF